LLIVTYFCYGLWQYMIRCLHKLGKRSAWGSEVDYGCSFLQEDDAWDESYIFTFSSI
jgi:hypothetical protein